MPTGTVQSLDDWLDVSRDPNDADRAGLYFIGTFDARITFYSQQVRALRLAQALDQKSIIQPNDRIAVVGAGAAGVTVALALAVLGHDVTLYDPADDVLQLQSSSPRLLHPHIYEWPKLGSLDDNAGLPLLNWSAGTGKIVAASLKSSFNAADTRLSNLQFKDKHLLKSIEKSASDWTLTLRHGTLEPKRNYQHIILAMGFGAEQSCGVSSPMDYWRPTGIGSAADEQIAGTSYLVSGNGDGALTELLGLLIKDFEHLTFTRRFLGMFTADTLRTAAEMAFAGAARGDDIEAGFQTHLAPILEQQGVLDRLEPLVRTDRTVTINATGVLFEAGRAAQLNQCMVFAVLAAVAKVGGAVTRSESRVTNVEKSGSNLKVSSTSSGGAPAEQVFEHVILRHGPNRKGRFEPVEAEFEAYKTYIAKLQKNRPELLDPPALDNETYQLFVNKAVPVLFDPAEQAGRTAQLQQQDTTIVIGTDAATHVLTECGVSTLAMVADQCERLSSQFIIRVDAKPSRIPQAVHLIRLARASGGKIHLKAAADVHPAWQALDASIPQAMAEPSNFAAIPFEPASFSEAIDACLMRLLETGVDSATAHNKCPKLGHIDPALVAVIKSTWDTWRSDLNAAPKRRADFLRWLANVDQREERPWNGGHDLLESLTSALILMLATHHGEALQPASADQGNLRFAAEAIALGSGCSTVDGFPIANRVDPQEWGVEALIVSGSSEIEILSASAGTVTNGGTIMNGVKEGKKVAPAVVQNSRFWRGKLIELAQWKAAVEDEFARFRSRQDEEYEKVTK